MRLLAFPDVDSERNDRLFIMSWTGQLRDLQDRPPVPATASLVYMTRSLHVSKSPCDRHRLLLTFLSNDALIFVLVGKLLNGTPTV